MSEEVKVNSLAVEDAVTEFVRSSLADSETKKSPEMVKAIAVLIQVTYPY